MAIHTLNGLRSVVSETIKVPNRHFFYWLTIIFNRVDKRRIEQVGPDRACAEWLLRNGAFVRWKGFPEFSKDYNSLPSEESRCYIEAVDATDAGISHVGFPHFEGCRYIEEIKLDSCRYIDNRALPLLSVLQDTLTKLELLNCKGINDEGLRDLKVLKNLKTLKTTGLIYLKDKDSIQKELTKALPNCKIEIG